MYITSPSRSLLYRLMNTRGLQSKRRDLSSDKNRQTVEIGKRYLIVNLNKVRTRDLCDTGALLLTIVL